MKSLIEAFFYRYAAMFNDALQGGQPDVEGTAACFADQFIEAGPQGVQCGKNDEQFRDMIPQGYAFYKGIGVHSMEITGMEITILDPQHSLAKVYWKSGFVRKDRFAGSIEFEVIYLVQTKDRQPKIFAYITGDEQAELKEKGLI